jgi:inward rectifier potassium channel
MGSEGEDAATGGAPVSSVAPEPGRGAPDEPVEPAAAGLAAAAGGGRFLTQEGKPTMVPLGLRKGGFSDFYHLWLTASWRKAIGAVTVAYFGINTIFALLYLLVGGVENMPADSFWSAFFFSAQTFSTVGYGHLAPRSSAANAVASVESFVALMATAMITGLMFAKFARPTARVLWSRVAVVAPQDGVPSLMFRMANERGNQVVEAQLRLALVRQERTVEGEEIRRVHDLRLVRAQSGVFALSWTAVHPIDASSKLYGLTREMMREQGAELIASLTGLDQTFSQTIHSRHSWSWDEIVWDGRFEDILGTLPDGRRSVDYRKFHQTSPLRARNPEDPLI